jgi:hypothetical protein
MAFALPSALLLYDARTDAITLKAVRALELAILRACRSAEPGARVHETVEVVLVVRVEVIVYVVIVRFFVHRLSSGVSYFLRCAQAAR